MNIAKDKEGNRRNYAFVTFQHVDSVPYTQQLLQGTCLFGHELRLQSRPGSCHTRQPAAELPASHPHQSAAERSDATADPHRPPALFSRHHEGARSDLVPRTPRHDNSAAVMSAMMSAAAYFQQLQNATPYGGAPAYQYNAVDQQHAHRRHPYNPSAGGSSGGHWSQQPQQPQQRRRF